MIHCSDCKHWDRDPKAPNDFHGDGFGLCRIMKVRGKNWRKNWREMPAMAQCYSEQIDGELLTQPTFGCILGEPKPPT